MVAIVRRASARARPTAMARSPENCAPRRRSCAATPSADRSRNPCLAKPSPSGPLFPGSWGSPAATRGRYIRTQFSATNPRGISTASVSLLETANAGAVSATRAIARTRASLYVDDLSSFKMMPRSSGSAPAPSSGSLRHIETHCTSGLPSASGWLTDLRTASPWDLANASISPAGAGHIGRSRSDGPSRRLSRRTPPGLSRVTSLRNARGRTAGGTCIHTALSRIRSKGRPV